MSAAVKSVDRNTFPLINTVGKGHYNPTALLLKYAAMSPIQPAPNSHSGQTQRLYDNLGKTYDAELIYTQHSRHINIKYAAD